ncbi:MAG TPA: single-stranded-DNA-specific exonuclease RecJ [Flavobacteriales bacterium]|jgi:single-stranded-DNA-specific exonuclease|nr:single-stranded-DNA-specific exonuclease RecJ [Flavobacteriales bacterium]HIB77060.1 single-stranded-DNA-specific exonuclease RecJ [Flavobacteriales bacterium]
MDILKWTAAKPPKSGAVNSLCKETGLTEMVAQILVQRGVENIEQAENFLRPKLEDLHDPETMMNMDKAVTRLNKAILKHERIMVYGDYDVDGTTSVAMVSSFLEGLDVQIVPYIPMRYQEGYGVSRDGVDRARKSGCTILITLDCGTKDFDALEYAASFGIDTIVCDHHLPDDKLPNCYALLNPKQPGCSYPFKELSGAGVAFKMLSALVPHIGLTMDSVYDHLDLLALSIGADLVDITGENRILAYHGMRNLSDAMRPGIKAMLQVAGIEEAPKTVRDISFTLGPRINAAGRVGHALTAAKLLMANDESEALLLANQLETMNQARRDLDEDLTEEAIAQMAEQPPGRACTIVTGEGWHRGVLGIVASRLVEQRYCPAIVLSEENEVLTGSARSVKGIDIHAAFEECRHLIEQFGGHPMAAGLTIRRENMAEFTKKLNESITKQTSGNLPQPTVAYHMPISLNDLNPIMYKEFERLGPFGPCNEVPVFMTEGVITSIPPRTVGHGGRHLKLVVQSSNNPQSRFEAIGFGMGERIDEVRAWRSFDIVFTLARNTFRGKSTLNLHLRDIRVHKFV